MSFEIKNRLMQLLSNDAVAYKIAYAFVEGDADKLSVFTQALQEQQRQGQPVIEAVASAAVQVAKARWSVMFPEEAAK